MLDLTVKAMRLRATVGEVSDALEKIFGRFRANNQTISGVYGGVVEGQESWEAIKADIAKFAEEEGRRPRIMIAKLGQDGHDRGAKVVATAYADLGFDIDMGPLFQTPEEAARQAIENDVHAIGVSSLAAGHKTLLPELVKSLKAQGADDIIVFAGGVIPAQDYDYLFNAGAKAIFGPGTRIEDSARKVLEEVIKYGPIADLAFLDWIEANLDALLARDPAALAHAVKRSCEIKAWVVSQDERESGLRAILNFGHTFGHAIEAGLGYGEWLHGEAVGCGMVMAARLSLCLGLVDAAFVQRLTALVARAGLPVRAPVLDTEDNAGRYLALMRVDKKAEGGEIKFVVVDGSGTAQMRGTPDQMVREVIDQSCAS